MRKYHDHIGYTLPTTKTTRGAGFGIGDRFKQKSNGKFSIYLTIIYAIGKSKSPSPDRYNVPSLFNPNNTTSTFAVMCKGTKTYSFGTGRESFGKTVINPKAIAPDKSNPGPGEYDPQHPLGEDAVGFKLKYKLDYGNPDKIARKRNIPAPGTYENILEIGPNGRYTSSQFSNSKSARWAKEERLRLPPSTHYAVPGPGVYNHTGNTGNTIQSVSSYPTVATRIFGKETRPGWAKTRWLSPGPGTYVPPSDFGYVTMTSPREKDDLLKAYAYGGSE